MTKTRRPTWEPQIRLLTRRDAIKLVGMGAAGATLIAACSDDNAGGAVATTAAVGTSAGAADVGIVDILFDYSYAGVAGGMGVYFRELSQRFSDAGIGEVGDLRELSYDETFPAIQANHAAGEGPDLETWYGNFNSYQFFAQGVLEPLNPWVGGMDEINHWKFRGLEIEGQTYNAPFYAEMGLMAVNRELLQKAGVEVGDRWESWEDFIDAAQKLKAAGEIPIIMGGADGFNAEKWIMASEMEFLDDPLQMTEWNIGTISADEPYTTSWIDRIGQIIQDGLANSDAGDITEQEGVELFGSGVGGMYIGYPGILFALADDKFDIVGYWRGPGAQSAPITTGGSGLVMTNFGGNPAGAGEFIKFMHQPEQLALFNEATSELPCDSRFDPSNLSALPAKTWKLLSSDPEPIWIHDFIHIDTITSIMYVLGPELMAGMDPAAAKASYIEQMDEWRERNPDLIDSLEGVRNGSPGVKAVPNTRSTVRMIDWICWTCMSSRHGHGRA